MIKLDWCEIEIVCEDLAQEIKECQIEFDFIYGVARGGLVPAVMLSHMTGIPMTTEYRKGKKILVVDDINDKGWTLTAFEAQKNAGYDLTTIVLYERGTSRSRADMVGDFLHSDDWIIFPWETIDNAACDQVKYERSRGL